MAKTRYVLAYPERFHAAASYAGFDGSPNSSITSKFSIDVALLLYGLHQQATVGPCNIPKPGNWKSVEKYKWTSWNMLDKMDSTEAMRLFVKILEEEDPGWYSRASDFVPEPVQDIEKNNNSKIESVIENGNTLPEMKITPAENGNVLEAQDMDVVMAALGSVGLYDQWVAPPVSGSRPKARYEHGAAVIDDKMCIYGGNCNGRYLNDLQVLDLRNWTWSRAEVKAPPVALEPSSVTASPCACHSLIPWGKDKLLSVGGHTKYPPKFMRVMVFDLQSCIWSALKTYKNPPVSRGGHSATLVGTSVVIFGGQDTKRSLLNDLHILDLETLIWDETDTLGVPPSPRFDHAAAVHGERYLLIFGGSSHATCFNDLHVLDLRTMEWSIPTQKGEVPSPRAVHTSATIGESRFIAGGDNNIGASETVVLNMSTLAWSVVTTDEGCVPLASEMTENRRWEDLNEDCLANIFGRLSLEARLLDVCLVCKSWNQTIHNPLCWQELVFPYSISRSRFSGSHGLVDCVVNRSQRYATLLVLPRDCSREELINISEKCPALKSLTLPDKVCDNHKDIIPSLILKWKHLEFLSLGSCSCVAHILELISLHLPSFSGLCVTSGHIDCEIASAIVSVSPQLKKLILHTYLEIGSLVKILLCCKNLVEFDIRHCYGFNPDNDIVLQLASGIENFQIENSISQLRLRW